VIPELLDLRAFKVIKGIRATQGLLDHKETEVLIGITDFGLFQEATS
jgi:hypothetical protein